MGLVTIMIPLMNGFDSVRLCCAGHYYNRIWVITAGCVLWGIMTAGFATTHSVAQVCSTRGYRVREPSLLS